MIMGKKREIVLIYNSRNKKDKETLALLTSLSNHIVNDFDIQKNKLTPRQITELSAELGIETIDMLEHQSENFKESFKTMSGDDLLKIVHNDMTLLKTPIVKVNGKTDFIKTPFDIYPIDLEIKTNYKKNETN
jgi:arsenate reductase-like glutaredoxin family protein